MGEIKINLNGISTKISKQTIENLLLSKKLNPNLVIIELNNQTVSKEKYNSITLSDNDTLEIIRYIGGGNLN